jgi:hypothetical protein
MESAQHFLVTILGSAKERVLISEHFSLAETAQGRGTGSHGK